MKKLKRKLVVRSVISLAIMFSGAWGFFGPFELSIVTPENHLIVSFCGMILGYVLFCWGLDSYSNNAYIVTLKNNHAADMIRQYAKIQQMSDRVVSDLNRRIELSNQLKEAQIQAISWKGNFKKIQKRYNEQKK